MPGDREARDPGFYFNHEQKDKAMVKEYRFTLSIGIANARQEEAFPVELPDDATEEQIAAIVDDEWRTWAWEHIDGGPHEV